MAVAGNFPDVSFPDLIQFYCLSKKTVAIRVTCPDLPEASGEFYVADGELLDAKLGDRVGVEAVYRALHIHRGSFEIQIDVRPPSRSIHLPLNEVLLQGLTRLDEAGKSGSGPRLTHRDVLDQVEEAFTDSPTQPPVVTGPLPQPLDEVEEEDPALLAAEARRRKVVGLVVVGASLLIGILAVFGIGMFRASAPPVEPATSAASGGNEAVTPPGTLSPAPRATQGVTDTAVVFGMAAPFTGPAKELGRQTRVGIELAFAEANAQGGVRGRLVRLQVSDNGFEPARVAPAMRTLWETDKVFAFLGNVGPLVGAASGYAVDRRAVLIGAFSGSAALRKEPPDRYVFNYRASDAEETGAVFKYLLSVRALRPEQIAVLTEDDASGDAGFDGVARVLRQLRRDPRSTLRVTYPRNTLEVDAAVTRISNNHAHPIRAVVMVVPYRPAARFIERMRRASPEMVFTNVSSVGANALAEELAQSSPEAGEGVIVTQVVPPLDSEFPAVSTYRAALAKYLPDERPDPVSLESWLATRILLAGVTRAGQQLDAEKLVDALESIRDLDLGTGTPVSFGPSEHQASHRVWGTVLDAHGQYRKLALE